MQVTRYIIGCPIGVVMFCIIRSVIGYGYKKQPRRFKKLGKLTEITRKIKYMLEYMPECNGIKTIRG